MQVFFTLGISVFLLCLMLGYVKFITADRTLSSRCMRHAVLDEIYVQQFGRALDQADSTVMWWEIVSRACNDLRFASAHMEFQGRAYYEQFVPSSQKPTCRIRIGFGDDGHLSLTRVAEQVSPRIMMAVLDQLQHSLEHRQFVQEASELLASNAA
jgi:hypothetical protein